jgi:tetratricopeptide (TPR) repeat protein
MKIALPKLQTSHLTANEEALHRCQVALEHKDREDYAGAQEVMRDLWQGIDQRPETGGLHPSIAAEVLLCVGIVTSWMGSKNQIEDAQEIAKNFITESIAYFESVNDVMKIGAARTEIAYCYWRDGELNEARIMLREALKKLTTEGTTRARALLKLTVVECSAARYDEALGILADNATLFQKIRNHAVKGTYHTEFAIILRNLAKSENKDEYLRQAISEFQKADQEFKLARNPVFRSDLKKQFRSSPRKSIPIQRGAQVSKRSTALVSWFQRQGSDRTMR